MCSIMTEQRDRGATNKCPDKALMQSSNMCPFFDDDDELKHFRTLHATHSHREQQYRRFLTGVTYIHIRRPIETHTYYTIFGEPNGRPIHKQFHCTRSKRFKDTLQCCALVLRELLIPTNHLLKNFVPFFFSSDFVSS